MRAKATNITELDPQLRDLVIMPDFRPQQGSPALNPANIAPGFANDPFFVTANYIGAFDSNTDWTLGWTKWAFGQ
jgi:hypothetical protein